MHSSSTLLRKASIITLWMAASSVFAAPITPVSYSMINGGGTASGGQFNYWDVGYSGSGSTTTDGAALSGGLGKLTDGVIATQRWDAVSNLAGTGQYVGWRLQGQPNPTLTFNFTGNPAIDRIDIWIDNSQLGGVAAPASILIDGVARSFSAAVGNGVDLSFTELGLTGNTHTIQFLQQSLFPWVFVSEITFSSGTTAVPVPASLGLLGLAMAALAAMRRGRLAG